MILVDGDKYACEQCIRGHRSSQCQHIKRPLVLVRSRGRPATDSSKRIAIMGELLLPPDSPHDSREHSGCPQSRNPENSVIVLKANKRQVFNVSRKSLKLLDPVIEVPSKQAGLDLISTRSHGRGKCRSKRAKLQPEQEPVTYDMFLTESCTVPGSCLCEPDACTCHFCQVHSQGVLPDPPRVTCGEVEVQPEPASCSVGSFDEECCCAADDCGCYNCEKHGIVNGQKVGLQEAALSFLNSLDISELDLDCCCPDDACNCTNCFKHGRFQNQSINDS